MNIPKNLGIALLLVLGLMTGLYIASEVLSHLPDYPEKSTPVRDTSVLMIHTRDYNAPHALTAYDSDGNTWNGEQHQLQPSYGYRALQAPCNPETGVFYQSNATIQL